MLSDLFEKNSRKNARMTQGEINMIKKMSIKK